VNHGATTQFTFTAGTGYHLTSVSGCEGVPFTNTSNGVTTHTYTTGPITGACTLSAAFAINQYTLNYSAGVNGSITGDTPQTVNHGGSGTAVAALPAAGYHFVNWSDGSPGNPRTDINVTGNITVTAKFAINTYPLTYNAGPHGSITGTSPQTVNHGASGTAVTAVPGTGYYFVNWSDGVLTASRTDTNVTGDITVTANFAINRYTVTASIGRGGSLDPGTPSPRSLNHGETAQFTVNADAGNHVVSVSGCGGTPYANTDKSVVTYTYTTGILDGDCTVTGDFEMNYKYFFPWVASEGRP
jgi:hypothetical protein